MPASLFSDMDRNNRSIEEKRAFELALEMSMEMQIYGMNNENDPLVNSFDGEPRGKKSQNTTECVPVPSSEHVAEIVGRQGCKIKALRAKTNTYIKTPVRGEEPVFVVTGRKEDVNAAKREILSAAEHFSQIRAQRKSNLNGSAIPGPNSNIPGQTTIQVRVPYRVVGLVVGPKGATIKRIQQQTNTYIVTPSRDKEPIFEVTGLPDNVESARKEIEAHIAMRTGGSVESVDDEYNANFDAFTNNLNALNSSINNSIFKTDMGSNFICPFPRDSNNLLDLHNVGDNAFNFPASSRSTKQNDMFNNMFNFSSGFGLYDTDEGLGDSPTFETPSVSLSASSWPDFGTSTLTDSGISLFGSTSSSNGLSDLSQRSNSMSGTLTDLIIGDHPPARRIRSEPLSVPEVGDILGNLSLSLGNTISSFSPLGGSISSSTAPASLTSGFPAAATKCTSSSSSSPIESLAPGKKLKRDCIVCFESAIVAALVPCGHNLFCLECASRICEKADSECPICRQHASQAIRIYS